MVRESERFDQDLVVLQLDQGCPLNCLQNKETSPMVPICFVLNVDLQYDNTPLDFGCFLKDIFLYENRVC